MINAGKFFDELDEVAEKEGLTPSQKLGITKLMGDVMKTYATKEETPSQESALTKEDILNVRDPHERITLIRENSDLFK